MSTVQTRTAGLSITINSAGANDPRPCFLEALVPEQIAVLDNNHKVTVIGRFPKGTIKEYGQEEKTPFYTYYRRAQAAQSLGMLPVKEEMIRRIDAMLYKGSCRSWGLQITDMKLIYEYLKPDHWVRRCISKSIAVANIDRVLRNEAMIEQYMKEQPEVFKEIMVFVDREREFRAKKAADEIRAARRAKRAGL